MCTGARSERIALLKGSPPVPLTMATAYDPGMPWFKRSATNTPAPEPAPTPPEPTPGPSEPAPKPAVSPRPAPDGKGITFPNRAAIDHWKRRVADAGLTVQGLEVNGDVSYLTLSGPDPEGAKEFLRNEFVDRQLFYIVVVTPDGAWGLDIEGLYLEKLRPWQLDTSSPDYRVPAGAVGASMNNAVMAKRGRTDNFLVWVGCGGCDRRWTDGVRYQDVTMTRCPSCGAKNLVDSSNIHVYDSEERPKPSSPLSASPEAPTTAVGDEAHREQLARRLAESVQAYKEHYGELTEEQIAQTQSWHYLDAVMSAGDSAPDWLGPAIELRSIGHQLNREGGSRLMRETAVQADRLSPYPGAVEGVIDLFWDRIGGWRG